MSSTTREAIGPTAREFGDRWADRFSFNQVITNVSLLMLWQLVFVVSMAVLRAHDAGLSAETAQLFTQFAWAISGLHVTLGLHLDKAIFVFLSMAAETSQSGGGESGPGPENKDAS